MKLFGEKIPKPEAIPVIIPRGNGKDLVFLCDAVLSTEEFERLCPVPTPPAVIKKGNKREENPEDKGYLAQLDEREGLFSLWLFIKSLENTPGLEWETIDKTDPTTWRNIDAELDEILTSFEKGRLLQGFREANGLSEKRIEEARQVFLRGGEEKPSEATSGPHTEQQTVSSGKLTAVSA